MASSPPACLAKLQLLIGFEFSKYPELYHSRDIGKVGSCTWQLEQYLHHAETVEEAFENIKEALQWKKVVGVHEKNDIQFARELYEINGLEIIGHTAEGSLVVWHASCFTQNLAELKSHLLDLMSYQMEQLYEMAGCGGIILISDHQHVSIETADPEVTCHLNQLIFRRYPGTVKRMLLFNLSSSIERLVSFLLQFTSKQMRSTVIPVNQKTIVNYLDSSLVPVADQGTRRKRHFHIPPGALSLSQLGIKVTEATKQRCQQIHNMRR